MHGDLTEARCIAINLAKIHVGSPPKLQYGEMYSTTTYTFPEGEAFRFTIDSGYDVGYYDVNEEGLSVLTWQQDNVANREWGRKPKFESSVYFMDEYMGGVFSYGKVDGKGNMTELDRYYRDNNRVKIVPIDGEKRTDARP